MPENTVWGLDYGVVHKDTESEIPLPVEVV